MNEVSSQKRKIWQQRYREKHYEEIKKRAREQARKRWAENPEECRKYQRELRAKHPEHYRKKARDYYQKNIGKQRKWARKYARGLRQEVIKGYGGKCTCCEENNQEFLALDHVNGGGTQERKKTHVHTLYRYVVKNNFPPEYRILCHNCNASLGHYGYCPHNLLKK